MTLGTGTFNDMICKFIMVFMLGLICICSSTTAKANPYSPEDSARIQIMIDSVIAYAREDSDWAMMITDSILNESRRVNYPRGLINGYNQKGNVFWNKGDFAQAKRYYLEALYWTDSIPGKRGKAIVLNNIGTAERLMGNYPEALSYHLASRNLFEEEGMPGGMASAINNAAIVYKILEDDSTAIQEYKLAASLSGRIHKCAAYLNISIIFQEHLELDSASYYLDKVFAIGEDSLPPLRLSQAQSALATQYSLMQEYDSALHYVKMSQQTIAHLSTEYMKLTLAMKEGNIRRLLGQRDQARRILNQVRQSAVEMNSPEVGKSALEVLIGMDAHDKDYKGAFEKSQLMIEIQDSILGSEQQRRVAQRRVQAEIDQREEEVSELNSELAQETEAVRQREVDLEESRNRIWLLIALVAVLMFAVGITLTLWWGNRKRTRLLREKQEVTERSLREKEVLVGEVHHRVKNNLQVIYNILDLQSRTLEDGKGKTALQESMLRISSMALVHNELYRENDLTGVRMEEYLPRLTNHIQRGFNNDGDHVNLVVEVTPGLTLDLDSAIPIGMLINELITNAMKYAFPGNKKGQVDIRLKKEASYLNLEVADNGIGKSLEPGQGSFGTRLIKSLVRQLKGTLKEEVNLGTTTKIAIKKYKELAI